MEDLQNDPYSFSLYLLALNYTMGMAEDKNTSWFGIGGQYMVS